MNCILLSEFNRINGKITDSNKQDIISCKSEAHLKSTDSHTIKHVSRICIMGLYFMV